MLDTNHNEESLCRWPKRSYTLRGKKCERTSSLRVLVLPFVVERCSYERDMDPMKNGVLRHGSNMWWIVAYLQPQTVVGSRCASCRWDNSDQSGSSGPSSCWTPLPWVGMCENCNFLFQMPGYLCYSDVCSSRRDHDEIIVAHRHILVLDHIGRRLTSGTVPSANSTFVLLLKNASFKCAIVDFITTYKIYIHICISSTKGKCLAWWAHHQSISSSSHFTSPHHWCILPLCCCPGFHHSQRACTRHPRRSADPRRRKTFHPQPM